MSRMFRSAGVFVLFLLAAFDYASAGPRKVHVNQFAASRQPSVVMINGELDPPVLKVKEGTVVEWINNGDSRRIAAKDASFTSGVLKPGASFQHTFNKRGRYEYRCRSQQEKMGGDIAGTILVTK
jgi:plastocyanin